MKKYGLVWEDYPEEAVENFDVNKPYLCEVKEREIKQSDDELTHLLIEGDNYEALRLLQDDLKNKISVIYIDPPYNTKNKFVYNDNYKNHSRWLSFMHKRLVLARELLTDDGVIFISIDDNEFAQLKLLCDEVFGEQNFITMFLWEKTQHFGRQKKNFYSNADYILCYCKNLNTSKKNKEVKKKEILVEYKKDEFEDAPLYNNSNKKTILKFPKGTVEFKIPDNIYKETTDRKYDLIEPVIVENSRNKNDLLIELKSRWQQAKIDEHVNNGGSFIVKTENFAIRAIYGDRAHSNESPKQIIFTNKNNEFIATSRLNDKVGTNEEGSSLLKEIVNEDFSYPKPISLISYLISLVFNEETQCYKKDLIILDFFAGSGTTGHAVLELNKKDGGNRQFILCTNNENNICEEVTYARLNKVINGYTTPKGKEVEGVPANLKYYKVKHKN